jgi:small subunit ribosomal protein S16
MAVRIRLTRIGKKKQPTYRVIVADQRAPRDGRYIEQIGRYDPRQDPSVVVIDNERALYWLDQGAQPSDAVRKLLEISGALEEKKVTDGKVHVVGADAQRAAAEEDAAIAAKAEAEAEAAEAEAAEEDAAEAEAAEADFVPEPLVKTETAAEEAADDDGEDQ